VEGRCYNVITIANEADSMLTRKVLAKKARKGFKVLFRHPVHEHHVSRGLGPDKIFADAVCFGLTLICNDPILCQADIKTIAPLKLREVGFGAAAKKAMEIFYGPHELIEKLFENDRGLTDEDLADVKQLAEKWNANAAGVPNCEEYDPDTGQLLKSDPESELNPRVVALVLERFMPAKVRELRDAVDKLETQIQAARADREELLELREDCRQLRRRLNQHVKEKIGKAAKKWYVDIKKSSSARNGRDAERWMSHFIDTLPEKENFPLAELRRQHVIAWLRAMNKKPRTLVKRRNYVTGFSRWCVHEYDLVNPLGELPTIKGVSAQPKVQSILHYHEFEQLLAALEPYWKTMVATCVLAGPREGELLRMKIDDVSKNGIKIFATKTGRHRM